MDPKLSKRNWSFKEGLDLIVEERRINGQILLEWNAMILMRSLANGNQGQEMVPELGLAIYQDPTVRFTSNLEGL